RFWITLEQGVEFVLHCLDVMHGGEIFVPKIPSMRILDLVTAVAPDCRIEVTGIRPGEKVHEVLVSEDEAHHTIELDDLYVINPRWDIINPRWVSQPAGRALADGFRFSSDTNSRWLSIDDLRTLLA